LKEREIAVKMQNEGAILAAKGAIWRALPHPTDEAGQRTQKVGAMRAQLDIM
jgi:hypothetical protein